MATGTDMVSDGCLHMVILGSSWVTSGLVTRLGSRNEFGGSTLVQELPVINASGMNDAGVTGTEPTPDMGGPGPPQQEADVSAAVRARG